MAAMHNTSGRYAQFMRRQCTTVAEVAEKIQALLKPLEIAATKDSLNARQQRIDFILERIEICKQKDDEQSLIRWNDQLCKIYALYKDTEQEQKQESSINNLDISTLKRLSGIS